MLHICNANPKKDYTTDEIVQATSAAAKWPSSETYLWLAGYSTVVQSYAAKLSDIKPHCVREQLLSDQSNYL